MNYYLPGIGGQFESKNNELGDIQQGSQLLFNSYSPRLFGAPPQLTHLNDMRLLSADYNKNMPGPVGDFYLNDILRDAHIANFCVGRALFTGGMHSIGTLMQTILNYSNALANYSIYGHDGKSIQDGSSSTSTLESIQSVITEEKILSALESDNGAFGIKTDEETGDTVLDIDDASLTTSEGETGRSFVDKLMSGLGEFGAVLKTPFLSSFGIQQPFYTFESDWHTYINNVKMMINSGVIMLGLQDACVRIGDYYLPIGMDSSENKYNDVWANYRFLTPTEGLGAITAIDKFNGDTSQYVSFMVDPLSFADTFTNTVGESMIYSSLLKTGDTVGNEIAFITNSSRNTVDDEVIKLVGEGVNVAESLMTNLTGGIGRFTAAIAGSMGRSFLGDHTIYPKIFQSASASSTAMTIKTKFVASSGDPYSFLLDIWVPMCFVFGMALPKMGRSNAAAYSYPPIVQCNIPGIWGTRLGIITSLTVTKNPDGKSVSINGYPTSVEVSMQIEDLQHALVTTQMDQPAMFLNNNTMFDYIAQSCGCDKYRLNSSIRLVTKLALAAHASNPSTKMYHLGSAMLSDFSSIANRVLKVQ